MRLGVWALLQAETLTCHGVDLKVVSPTSQLPAVLGRLGIAPWAACCPLTARVGSLDVTFPRWPYYYAGFMRRLIRRYPSVAFGLAWPALRKSLLAEIAAHRPQVIFANHSLDGGEAARRIQLETGIPYVVAEHDFGEITDCHRYPARHLHYLRVMSAASSVLAVSERMKAEILSVCPHSRVVIARHGREPLPAALLARPRPMEMQGKIIVLSASGLFERKGVPLLIEAFSRIATSHPNAELRIVGDGPERGKVQAAVHRHDKTGQVRVVGALPHDELLQEMAWSDVFALIGWDEPYGIVYVEALAAGKPLICCDDGGICDVVRNHEEALLVPPQDVEATAAALRRLISDTATRERMSAAADKLFHARLTSAAYAQTIINELKRAVGGVAGAHTRGCHP